MIYRAEDLTFKYSESDRKVLDGASLSLDEGQILCILGPNGAGKTTLLNCLARLLEPQQGKICLQGRDMKEMTEKEIARQVAYVPQLHVPSFDYRVLDFVMMGRAPGIGMFGKPTEEDEERCHKVLEEMGIEHLAERSYMEISGGERQQLLIARALVQDPKVILFDEPTAHLDYGNQHRVLSRIRKMAEAGYSVVITTHNPDHALLLGGGAALLSRDGKLVQGSTDDIVTEERLREIYGIDIIIRYSEDVNRKVCLTPGL